MEIVSIRDHKEMARQACPVVQLKVGCCLLRHMKKAWKSA